MTTRSDSGPGSLRAAILAANKAPNADTIDVRTPRGNIKLLSVLPQLKGQCTLIGPGSNQLVLRRSSRAPFNLLAVANGAKIKVVGLTLTGGGGGLEMGGAIANDGALSLSNCTITNNSARKGGGVFSTGNLAIANCTFSNNSATAGGAINSVNGSLTVSNSTFSGNASEDDGGALFLSSTPTSLASSTFSNNQAGTRSSTGDFGWGGGVCALAQFNLSSVGLATENCTFVGNKAGRGGAFYLSGQRTEIKNATICDNLGRSAAGIWSEGNAVTHTFLRASIVVGNSDYGLGANDVDNGLFSRGYNLVGSGGGLVNFNQPGDRAGMSRQDLVLGTLSSNGGPTQTLMPSPISPAVNAIPVSALAVKVDQRGKARPIGSGGDVGAVEADDANTSSSLVVNTTADTSDGACTATNCTLREAIETANAAAATGSTQTYSITFDPAVFSVPQTIIVVYDPNTPSSDRYYGLFATGKIKITGPGSNLLTIHGSTGFISPRSLYVNSTASVQVSGIAFSGSHTNGYQFGGAIYNAGNLELTDCLISDNVLDDPFGGGIYNEGNLSVLRCNISHNIAGAVDDPKYGGFGGGGICNIGVMSVKDSLISNNEVKRASGGGIANTYEFYNSSGVATIENTTISNNFSSNGGGGIDNRNYGDLTTTLTLLNCTISGNSTQQAGSAIFSAGPLTMRNSTVTQNDTTSPNTDSSGIYLCAGNEMIENSTIVGNTQNGKPVRALTIYDTSLSIKNSVIASGPAAESPDVYLGTDGSVNSGGYNFVGYSDNTIFNGPGDQVGNSSNVLDPRLGPLASNGGLTQTLALLSDSPLIDAGDPNFDTANLPYDQRGVGFPRIVGNRLDVGAFESSTNTASTARTTVQRGATPSPWSTVRPTSQSAIKGSSAGSS